jgi:hypothetical protein
VQPILSSFFGATPGGTPESPLGWVFLAAARRQLGLAQESTEATSTVAAARTTTALTAAATAPDRTAELQAKLDALKPGGTLTLDPVTYLHSGNLYIRVTGTHIVGNGATLQATNPATSAVWVEADNVSISNLKLAGQVGATRIGSTNATGLIIGRRAGVSVSDVTVTGGASAGMMLIGSTNFRLDRVTIRDTAADGIQLTDGASNGQLNNVRTERTGDDGIAVVSYAGTGGKLSHDIVVNSPIVNGSVQRGLVVTGGDRITFNNINVSNTALSGVFIGNQLEPTYSTQSATNIKVIGGTITSANSATTPTGAITVLSQNPGSLVSNITVSNVSIVNTAWQAVFNIGHANYGGGAITNVAYTNIAIKNWWPFLFAIGTNAPGTYIATGFTMNGKPINPASSTLIV